MWTHTDTHTHKRTYASWQTCSSSCMASSSGSSMSSCSKPLRICGCNSQSTTQSFMTTEQQRAMWRWQASGRGNCRFLGGWEGAQSHVFGEVFLLVSNHVPLDFADDISAQDIRPQKCVCMCVCMCVRACVCAPVSTSSLSLSLSLSLCLCPLTLRLALQGQAVAPAHTDS